MKLACIDRGRILPALAFALFLPFTALTCFSQGVHISETSGSPHPSAMLDVESGSRGFLPPRLSSDERDAINSPAPGLMIFNTDSNCLNYFSGTEWMSLCGLSASPPPPSFACGTSSITDVDGHTYSTVEIGSQCWMQQNLRTSRYANGDVIPNVSGSTEWSGLSTGAWVHYDNDTQYELPYGKLYNWFAGDDPRNLCPAGWHVPSFQDWDILISFLGGDAIAGAAMKEAGTQHWNAPNQGSTNSSGFTALPAGYRSAWGDFENWDSEPTIGEGTFWWSTSEWIGGSPCCGRPVGVHNWYDDVTSNQAHEKQHGYSIRCVKD